MKDPRANPGFKPRTFFLLSDSADFKPNKSYQSNDKSKHQHQISRVIIAVVALFSPRAAQSVCCEGAEGQTDWEMVG